MKKTFLLLAALFASIGLTTAQTLTIPDVEILQGGTASFELVVDVPADSYAGFQFETTLPDGITYTENTTVSSDWDGSFLTSSVNFKGSASSSKLTPIPAGGIVIATAEIEAAKSLATGTYNVTISNFEFLGYSGGAEDTKIADVTFKVTVVDRITLDETATVAPAAATGVNVKVKRTIDANMWSTICLPFAMDATQVKAAFGDDVKLGDFTGYTPTYDAGDNVTAITVNFNDATAIEANHPYIIKVSSDIKEFTADAVTIDPQEAIVSFGETTGTGKNKKYHPSDFIGTYVADFDFYSEANSYPLFLHANKFYYATDKTMHMKAFRAFFDLDDYLPEVEGSDAPVFISFDNNATGIENIQRTTGDDRYYNLNGQHVENLRKGQIYIKNNKKVVVK